LPREIFVDENISSIDDMKYIVGRAAIEKRLEMPLGSFDSINSTMSGNNLEKLLKSVGRRKIEHEAGLKSGDLEAYYAGSNTSKHIFEIIMGQRVIEKELSLKSDSWPTSGGFSDVVRSIGDLRSNVLKVDPLSIDSLLNITPHSTSKLIKGEISVGQYTVMVGQSRINDTLYGLRYFAAYNTAYNLPGPTKDFPSIPDTWALALSGEDSALQTIGIYTIARLLSEDAVPEEFLNKNTEKKYDIYVTENDATQLLPTENFGQFVFREWLRQNISQDDCRAGSTRLAQNYTISNNGTVIYNGTISNQSSRSKIDTAPSVLISYELRGKNEDGQPSGDSVSKNEVLAKVSEQKAFDTGLERYDLQRMLGCSSANGRSVFERIGAKLLYVGIANNLLNSEERTRIDLLENNPSLNIDNPEVSFYVSRAIKIIDLTARIQQDADNLSTDELEVGEIKTLITDIVNKSKKIFNEADPDILQTQNIVSVAADIIIDLDQLRDKLVLLKERYEITKGNTASELEEINILIIDVNNLIHAVSEIIAGKEISNSDYLQIGQIDTYNLLYGQGSSNSGSNDSGGNGLSTFQIGKLIFLFLAGKIDASELMLRLGANIAESNLDLPPNTLLYLVQNYQKRGMIGSDSLFQALGQAKIEKQFGMQAYYFQGLSIDTKPNFRDPTTLQHWLPENSPYKNLRPEDFAKLVSNLSKEGTTITPQGYRATNAAILKQLHESAYDNWQKYRTAMVEKYGNVALGETNLDDVVKNIENRDMAGTGSGQDDLLMRLGFPKGRYEALKDNSPVAWGGSVSRSIAIDRAFNIREGSTKSLFTEETSLFNTSIGNDDKRILEARMGLSKNVIDKYIQLVNGEVTPSERDEYLNGDLSPDYTGTNPYADSADSCPIDYSEEGGFHSNSTSLENGSFCYYDKKGRHCFASWEEAQRYSNEHKEDQLKGIIHSIAQSLTIPIEGSETSIASATGVEYSNLVERLTRFVNSNAYIPSTEEEAPDPENFERTDPQVSSVFNDREWGEIEKILSIPLSTLKKLFSRESVNSPVPNYKKLVGKAEAKRVLTNKLFESMGIDVDPEMFDADDFYAVLNGDFRSLYRIATSLIDNELGLKPGTTLMIYNARTPEARECALRRAGEVILGDVFGLDYISLGGNPIKNIGQAKIEQTLKLPKDTFWGGNINEVIKKVRPINFIDAFSIPVDHQTLERYFPLILGEKRANTLASASATAKISALREHVTSSVILSNSASRALAEYDRYLLEDYLPGFLSKLRVAPDQIPAKISGSFENISENDRLRLYETKKFFDRIVEIDSLLSIEHYLTYEFLTGIKTPGAFNNYVGEKLAQRAALEGLGQLLGLSDVESEAATNLITNISRIFICSRSSQIGVSRPHTVDGCPDTDMYHNWSYLYENLDLLFGFRLDERMSWPAGTTAGIIENPSSAIPTLLAIGAQRLDAQMQLDSEKFASFSGLYRAFYTDQTSENLRENDAQCHEQAYPGGMDIALNTKLVSLEKELSLLLARRPADLPDQNRDESDSDYLGRLTGDQRQWVFEYSNLRREINETNDEINSRNQQEHLCRQSARADSTGSGYIPRDEDGNPLPTSWQGRAWEWAQNAVAEKIHEAIYNIKVKNEDGSYTRIGVDMPIRDIRQLMRGDLRFFPVVTAAFTVNVAMLPLDRLGTTNCNERVSGMCRMAVPEEFRISYNDLRLAYIGLPNIDAYQMAAWQEVNEDPAPNNTNQPYCYSSGCPSTGSGSFADSFVDSIGNGDHTLSTEQTLEAQYGAEYGYSESRYNELINDPNITPQQRDILENPAKYYNPNYNGPSGNSNYSAAREERIRANQRRVRQMAFENLQYKLIDMGLWKIDAGIFPGFAKAIIKGNTEIKIAALGKYIRNGLRNGYILGIKFDPVQIDWVNVAKFVYDRWVINDPKAFENFVGNGGFDFLSGYIASRSEALFGKGVKITPAMAQGLIVGVATGNWGIDAISFDNVMSGNESANVKVGERSIPTLGSA
ncbi:MAG TPA: hypothetical protein PK263_04135, partial [bacterium]|nr:hypothetical protein [bacterium]